MNNKFSTQKGGTLVYVLLAVLAISIVGYFVISSARKYVEPNTVVRIPLANVKPTAIPVAPTLTPSAQPTQTKCETVDTEFKDIKFCSNPTKNLQNEIKYQDQIVVSNVEKYDVSPSKKWIFIVGYSKGFATNGGAPAEEALYMMDVTNGRVFELFSQIYFTNFISQASWSSNGDGMVFTAGGSSKPLSLANNDPFAVVYCTTTCKVLARDAGPEGIGGAAASFSGSGNEILYSDKQGNPKTIDFKN